MFTSKSPLPSSSPIIDNRQYNNSKFASTDYSFLSLYKLGFKLVLLDNNHEHDDELSTIVDNPDYWLQDSFNDPTVCSRFANVASALGKTHLKDSENKELYLQVLDTDSDYVYNIVSTPFAQLITVSDTVKKNIYDLLNNVGGIKNESQYSKLTLLEICKRLTFVTKTKKANGYHIWWLSSNPNESILTYECKSGFEVGIKGRQ